MSIAGAITEIIDDLVLRCVGNTPLVALNRLLPEAGIEVIAKFELSTIGRVS
jgi:N-(2-amino-2-carboxyethyl)-L-glutamate synthase